MVKNDLPQVLKKKTATQNMSVCCGFIKALVQVVDNHTMKTIS